VATGGGLQRPDGRADTPQEDRDHEVSLTLHGGKTIVGGMEVGSPLARTTLRASVATSALGGIAVIVVGLAGSWLLVYVAGGADTVVPHLFYLPILFAAARFGPSAALLVALLSAVLAGPLTHVNVVDATTQEAARWLTRGVFFVGIGQLMAWMVRPSLPSIRDEIRRLREEHELRLGIENEELFLRYQPIVTVDGERVVGMEALVRWRHPERGELSPDAFLPTAEQCELIHDLGAFVLRTACSQAARWAQVAERAGAAPWFVSVNLGGSEVAAPDLADRVRRALAVSGLDPRHLCLEITEGVLVDDRLRSAAQLARLKQLGVRVAVDDFGTGYSSLSYLRDFPIDVVKFDRSFVIGLQDERAAAMVAGLVQLCHGLGFETVAEGIEEIEQGRRMAALDCDLAQGFHFSRPLDVAAAHDLLLAGPRAGLPQLPSEA
jgi:diguanylate cyclase